MAASTPSRGSLWVPRREGEMNRKLAPHHSDWGTFNAVVEGSKGGRRRSSRRVGVRARIMRGLTFFAHLASYRGHNNARSATAPPAPDTGSGRPPVMGA